VRRVQSQSLQPTSCPTLQVFFKVYRIYRLLQFSSLSNLVSSPKHSFLHYYTVRRVQSHFYRYFLLSQSFLKSIIESTGCFSFQVFRIMPRRSRAALIKPALSSVGSQCVYPLSKELSLLCLCCREAGFSVFATICGEGPRG
jgi:hypothetical protein